MIQNQVRLFFKVEAELSKIDPYFTKLAKGMRAWIAAWDMVNGTTKEANGKSGSK